MNKKRVDDADKVPARAQKEMLYIKGKSSTTIVCDMLLAPLLDLIGYQSYENTRNSIYHKMLISE